MIQIFNKRFNKEYPNVSKPIVCNGLREIKVYDPSEHLKRDVSVGTVEQDEQAQQVADDDHSFG